MTPFTADISSIRERARRAMSDGALTAGYKADPKEVVKILNDALATEYVCVLRYKQHYFNAKGLASESVRAEFAEHAREEQEHADWLAERIVQLNGRPALAPTEIARLSQTEYKETEALEAMVQEDLIGERIVIELYSEMIRWLGDSDPTTKRLFERILEVEEEHAEDLASLLSDL